MAGLVVFVVAMGLVFGLAFPFMWMWNYAVVAALSVAQPITYWPSFCLMLFIGIWLRANHTSK